MYSTKKPSNTLASTAAYAPEERFGQTPTRNTGHAGTAGHKKKCICPLYAYRRYDKVDPVRNEAPHYPENIKTIYTKDYTPKRADKNRMDFSPLRTVQKNQPLRDNYLTTNRKDYTPKAARSTTPIRNVEHNYHKDVPFKGHSEYQEMTKDAGDMIAYSPVKGRKEKYTPTKGPKEHTEYQGEYTPKRKTKGYPNDKLDNAIFKGSTQKKVGPIDDRTIYRVDFTPKPVNKNDQIDNGTFKGSNWDVRPKLFDGLTIYKKDYVGPEMYYCECPEGESHH